MFPNGSKWFVDDESDDNDIKHRYTLTEMTLQELKSWGDTAKPPPAVYTGDAFPDNTIFVRYPKNQPPTQPGGYLSVLAADINSVVQTASTMKIDITFFKGEKNIHDEANDKSNAEKAQLEFENFQTEKDDLLRGIKQFEKMNDQLAYRMTDPRTLKGRDLIKWCSNIVENDAPISFKDSSTNDVMELPVVAADGYTYEKDKILKLFNTNHHPQSPITGGVFGHKELIPNNSLKSKINEWMESKVKSKGELKARDDDNENFLQMLRIEFLNNTVKLQQTRKRLKELKTIQEGIFKKYETVPPDRHWTEIPRPVNRSDIENFLFKGGKSSRTRKTRKTRKRNIRRRRRTNNRRNAKK